MATKRWEESFLMTQNWIDTHRMSVQHEHAQFNNPFQTTKLSILLNLWSNYTEHLKENPMVFGNFTSFPFQNHEEIFVTTPPIVNNVFVKNSSYIKTTKSQTIDQTINVLSHSLGQINHHITNENILSSHIDKIEFFPSKTNQHLNNVDNFSLQKTEKIETESIVFEYKPIQLNPSVTIDTGTIYAADTTLSDDTIIFTGTATIGTAITIRDNGKILTTILSDLDEKWSYHSEPLSDGLHNLTFSDGSEIASIYFRIDTTIKNQPDHPWQYLNGWGFADALKSFNLLNKSYLSDYDNHDMSYATSLQSSNVNDINHYGLTGKNITVAIIDTGIDLSNTDFAGKIHQKSWNFANNGPDIQDQSGHGTAVASIIGAKNNGQGLTGGAYDADLMILKVAYDDGTLSSNAIINAITYAVDNGASVINISLGTIDSDDGGLFKNALDYAKSKDVLVFAAAGNTGNRQPDAPAILAMHNNNVAAVANGSIEQGLSPLSNESRSTLPYNFISSEGESVAVYGLNSTIHYWSGTSFSNAVLTAIAANFLSSDLNLTDDQVMRAIINGSSAFYV